MNISHIDPISEEHVVLVDTQNTVLGIAPKATVHTMDTPLHRAFSCFLFNERGELLLQQRSHKKRPGHSSGRIPVVVTLHSMNQMKMPWFAACRLSLVLLALNQC